MKEVLIDMHRLKTNPYNGLYQFSKSLGSAIAPVKDNELNWNFYLPKTYYGIFGNEVNYVQHHSIDKFFKAGTSKFDVWHITTQISWYKPFNKKTKVVFTLHDLNFLIEEKDHVKHNKRLLAQIQQRINRSQHVVCISEFALQHAQQFIDFGNKPTSVIYNAATVHHFPRFNSPVYQPSKPFLFAIGLVQPRKNFHTLPCLLKGNDYELVIAGLNDFPYAAEVRSEAQKWGVADRVKMIGAVSEEDKYWYYKHCEAVLFPSYAEGFGIPVVEGMSHGKPVFISTQTCLPEIGGKEAYYFEHFEATYMQQKLAEGLLHYQTNQPQDKIKARAAFFNWDRSAAEYIEVYKKVLQYD